MASETLRNFVKHCENAISKKGITLELCSNLHKAATVALWEENDLEYALELSKKAQKNLEQMIENVVHGVIFQVDMYCMNKRASLPELDLWWQIQKFQAPYYFESFLWYMERKRPYEKKFYFPRRKTLNVVVQDLQDLEERKYKFYGLSLPPRVGKSTICIFFMAWHIGRCRSSHNAMSGHSGTLAEHFYDEIQKLTVSDDYTFCEIFPEVKLVDKSAEAKTLKYDQQESFDTLTCRGIDGTWTGAVDISADGYLYVDDMVRDRTESLSPRRLEGRYQDYLNVLVDRKNDGSRELMVGTRWNVIDILGRIEKQYAGNPLYRFRKIPALNDDGESNFVYDYGKGFSKEYFEEVRDRLDQNEWMAKYQQKPFVREGILLPADDLRYFNGILPDGDSRIVAVCDVALGGGDRLSMPIGREYSNGDIYIFDWVFNPGVKEVTLPIVTGKIISNEIRQIRFEANQGGDLYCAWVDEMLQKEHYKCSCSHKRAPNTMEKTSKIIAYSGDIKRKFVFLDSRKVSEEQKRADAELGIIRYERSKEYDDAMDEMTTFVTIGKNEHDDAIDGIIQLDMYIENPLVQQQTVIMRSPI